MSFFRVGPGGDPVELILVSPTRAPSLLSSTTITASPPLTSHRRILALNIKVMAKSIERLDYDTSELIRLTGGSLSGVGAELAKYHPYAGTPTHRFCEPFYPEPLHNCTTYRKPDVDVPTYSADKCGFLTLPTELRLMVYEQLTVRTRQDLFHKLYNFEYNGTVYRDEVNFTLVTCKPRAPCMVTWIICQPISPPLHVYKLRSRTSQSRTRHFTIHLTTHFVSCSQLLTLPSPCRE
jgi:hypothetical protein